MGCILEMIFKFKNGKKPCKLWNHPESTVGSVPDLQSLKQLEYTLIFVQMSVLWFSAKLAKKPKCYRHFLPNLSSSKPPTSSPNMSSSVPALLPLCPSTSPDVSWIPLPFSFFIPRASVFLLTYVHSLFSFHSYLKALLSEFWISLYSSITLVVWHPSSNPTHTSCNLRFKSQFNFLTFCKWVCLLRLPHFQRAPS